MLKVNFYELHKVEESRPLFAVIVARYKQKCLFIKHKEKKTWEIPGGHREKDEDINTTALRELVEGTGAKDFKIIPVCIYSVEDKEAKSFGQLFYAEIDKLDELPDSEIREVKLFDTIPVNLTHPLIQPYLFNEVIRRIYN